MLSKSKLPAKQIEAMESLGFVLNESTSSDYNNRWDFHIYPDVTCSDKQTYTHTIYNYSDRVDRLKVLREMAKFYMDKGKNSVIGPIKKVLEL